jgi:hypothetical protein
MDFSILCYKSVQHKSLTQMDKTDQIRKDIHNHNQLIAVADTETCRLLASEIWRVALVKFFSPVLGVNSLTFKGLPMHLKGQNQSGMYCTVKKGNVGDYPHRR